MPVLVYFMTSSVRIESYQVLLHRLPPICLVRLVDLVLYVGPDLAYFLSAAGINASDRVLPCIWRAGTCYSGVVFVSKWKWCFLLSCLFILLTSINLELLLKLLESALYWVLPIFIVSEMGCFFIYHPFDICCFELFHHVHSGRKKKRKEKIIIPTLFVWQWAIEVILRSNVGVCMMKLFSDFHSRASLLAFWAWEAKNYGLSLNLWTPYTSVDLSCGG